MRTQVVKAFSLGMISGSFLTAGVVLLATPAKADGYLNTDEQIFVEMHYDAVCSTITSYPSLGGVSGVSRAIQEQGFSADSSVDIINASVQAFCPEHWPLLQAIGRAARASVA